MLYHVGPIGVDFSALGVDAFVFAFLDRLLRLLLIIGLLIRLPLLAGFARLLLFIGRLTLLLFALDDDGPARGIFIGLLMIGFFRLLLSIGLLKIGLVRLILILRIEFHRMESYLGQYIIVNKFLREIFILGQPGTIYLGKEQPIALIFNDRRYKRGTHLLSAHNHPKTY